MMPTVASGMCDSSSWGISEELSSSGSGLVGCASLQLQQQLPTHAVGEVTDSLGLGQLSEGVGFIDDVINETHLLQVRQTEHQGAQLVACTAAVVSAVHACMERQSHQLMVSDRNEPVSTSVVHHHPPHCTCPPHALS
jgi:hypothetical protein